MAGCCACASCERESPRAIGSLQALRYWQNDNKALMTTPESTSRTYFNFPNMADRVKLGNKGDVGVYGGLSA